MKKILNCAYGTIQGTYWMYFGSLMSFASVFLLGKDYTNSEIGVILAAANILAVLLQPVLADYADKSQKHSLLKITATILIGLSILTASLYFLPLKSLLLSIIFILLGAWLNALQPLINSMAFYLSKSGFVINFGITRSGGSVAYALLCAALGSLVTMYGIEVIPGVAIFVLSLLMAALWVTGKLYRKAIAVKRIELDLQETKQSKEAIPFLDFVKGNKYFMIFSVSIVFVFFQNSVFNNYLMQIITAIGGNSGQMGRLFSFMALLELPGLFFFSQLRKKFSCQLMLKVASIAFTVKVFLSFMAPSVGFIYIAFLLQLISFPIFLSASVHLVDEVMERGEAVKGQSFVTGMMTLSTVFAALSGGAILDLKGASFLLLVSTVLCAVGTGIVMLCVDRIKPKTQNHNFAEK